MANTTMLDRRTVLRGALRGAAIAVALPPLDAMMNGRGTAYAAGPVPKRFGIFWWGNGVRLAQWVPDGEGTGWTPREELAPLGPFKDYVSVLTGLGCPVRSGTAHHFGRAQMLTGTDQRVSQYGASVLPSLDQIVARRVGGETRFRSLEILVSRRGFENSRARGEVAQPGNGSFLPAEASPQALFDRLFGGGATLPATGDAGARIRAARQSVLDAVRADARRLEPRLGESDRRRLAEHLDGIRAIEQRIQTAPVASSCGRVPARPTVTPATDLGREDLEGLGRAMADLLAIALACDLTRAFSVVFSQMQSDTVFWQTGLNEGLHTVTHRSGSGDQCHKTVVFTMQQLAYLVGKLKATPEGAGNLLDSLCLYGCSEVAEGNSHSVSEMPMLVIGRAGGALRSGVHYRSRTRESTSKALLTMLKAMDVPVTTFGGPNAQTSETLPAIVA